MPITKASSNAVAAAAKGDLVVGNATNDSGVLAVGTANQVLTVDSAEALGLKWATPAGGGANWTLLNSGGTSLSGTVTTVSGISGVDKIMVVCRQASTSGANSTITIKVNGSSSAIYNYFGLRLDAPTSYSSPAVFSDVASMAQTDGVYLGKMSNSASSRVTGSLTMTGANSSGVKAFQSVGAGNPFGSDDAIMYIVQGYFDTSSTISSVSVVSLGTSFDAGTMYVYASA